MFIIVFLAILGLSHAHAPKNIFILAGQSNMSGRGGVVNGTWDKIVPPENKPNPAVFRFTPSYSWEEAREPLHVGVDCHVTCGIGPGMPFANTLEKLQPSMGTIGLVPCAHGGSHLNQWSRGGDYYGNLTLKARAAVKTGGVIRAMLWYQGENDADTLEEAKTYGTRFEKFVNDVRADLCMPDLPVIYVALASGRVYKDVVRAEQLRLRIPNVQCVDAMSSQVLPDNMHITTQAQVHLGEKLALAFLAKSHLKHV